MSQTQPDIDKFLSCFFNQPNLFSLEDIERDTHGQSERIRPWISRLKNNSPQFSILPCWRGGKKVDWYAVSFSEQELRKLREELLAFVGPSYSNFRGQRALLDLSDPIDRAVYDLTQGSVFKFQGADTPDGAKDVWQALELMRMTWDRRINRNFEVLLPKGRVLRNFYMALQAGNISSAEYELTYLKEHAYLDVHNLLFLKIQYLTAFGLWNAVLNLSELPDLLQMRRPLSVTEAIIKAVYHEELAQFEIINDIDGAIQHFDSRVLNEYSQLYNIYGDMKSPEALKSFMLAAISNSPPRFDLIDQLLKVSGLPQADKAYLQALFETISEEETEKSDGDMLQNALTALGVNDYDQAYNFALHGETSLKRTQILIRCSYEIQTLDSRKNAIHAFNTMVAEERAQYLHSRLNQNLLEDLREALKKEDPVGEMEDIPGGWLDWFKRLEVDTVWGSDEAIHIARQGVSEWRVEDLLDEPGAVKFVYEYFEKHSDTQIIQDALPHFLAAFQNDHLWPRREFVEIYWAMLEILFLSTQGGEDELSIFNDIVISILTLGCEDAMYREIIDMASSLWDKYCAPATVDWFLDFIDLLCVYPQSNTSAVLAILNAAAAGLSKFYKRIGSEQWAIFHYLCEDLHQKEMFEQLKQSGIITDEQMEDKANNPLSRLQGKSLAIYTLTESVGRRVKEIIERRCAGVQIQISSDKVGNHQLKDLSRNADIFVMATASATHAATGFIKDNRQNGTILYPKGKGSASMIREIVSYIKG